LASRADKPIGIFDSGVGGLTVFKEIRKALPEEDLVYLGDTARVPYGSKSAATVVRYALEDANFLLRCGVKMIVVACNTASALSLQVLKEKLSLPVVGVVEPGARMASQLSRGRIGIIGTEGTILSEAYPKAIRLFNPSVSVFSQACPLFVPLVEEGWLDNEVVTKVAEYYLRDLREREVDTLVLGCTHYPLLKRTIRRVMGDQVAIIDSAEAVCGEVRSILEKEDQRRSQGHKGTARIYVTDLPRRFERVGRLFLDGDLPPIEQVELEEGPR